MHFQKAKISMTIKKNKNKKGNYFRLEQTKDAGRFKDVQKKEEEKEKNETCIDGCGLLNRQLNNLSA
jgi:hypothetical protein